MSARKTRLDLLLDRVTPRHEVTIDADGYTPAQVDRIYATAKARGLHASGTRRWILIRDLSKMHGNAPRTRGGIPWVGTDYIERRYYAIQPGLADIYLAGVGRGRGMSTARADEFIERGRVTLGWLMAQNPAPTVRTRRWMADMIAKVRKLLNNAMAVRSGHMAPRWPSADRRRT